jgi:hypothetical protein
MPPAGQSLLHARTMGRRPQPDAPSANRFPDVNKANGSLAPLLCVVVQKREQNVQNCCWKQVQAFERVHHSGVAVEHKGSNICCWATA